MNGYISEEEQLEEVRQNGFIIEWIKNPSEKVQLESVKSHGWSILFIDNPSKQVQLEAIKQDPYILNKIKDYIKNPCEEILDLLMIKDIIE